MSNPKKIVVIVGPTASGKSELAVRLARAFNGEIISADSRQIYRGLNIGTAKVPGAWKRGGPGHRTVFVYKSIAHHCIDIASPRRAYTVAQFIGAATRAIAAMNARGYLPFVVGGTNFWVDALVRGLQLPAVAPDAKLRRALERRSTAKLHALLRRLDPERANAVDQKNPRRLIRAIEIARALGAVPRLARRPKYRTLCIGIAVAPRTLERNIERRARAMIRSGLAAETKKLLAGGISKRRVRELGFEYATALAFLEGRATREEFLSENIRRTRRYALRQMRQFRKNQRIRWVKNVPQARRAIRAFREQDSNSHQLSGGNFAEIRGTRSDAYLEIRERRVTKKFGKIHPPAGKSEHG